MLYKIEHGKSTFELNPQLKAIEEFSLLTDRQMAYVILVTDYKSPFRKLAHNEKCVHAAAAAGYKYEKGGKRLDMNGRNIATGKVALVEKAIRKYKELQKDEDYETLLSVSELVSQIRELNNKKDKSAVELEKAMKMTMNLVAITKIKKELEEVLEMREDPSVDPTLSPEGDQVIDGGSLSILAKLNLEQIHGTD